MAPCPRKSWGTSTSPWPALPSTAGQAQQAEPTLPLRNHNEKLWPGFDFNERVILCWCCGTKPIRSGGRWSPFFCRECQLMAMGVSLWHQSLVMPIGRHTLMHTFVPETRPSTLAGHEGHVVALAATVHASIKAVLGQC